MIKLLQNLLNALGMLLLAIVVGLVGGFSIVTTELIVQQLGLK
jgi:hypothetical protein